MSKVQDRVVWWCLAEKGYLLENGNMPQETTRFKMQETRRSVGSSCPTGHVRRFPDGICNAEKAIPHERRHRLEVWLFGLLRSIFELVTVHH